MPATGICTNIGNCSKADNKEPIAISAGVEQTCPECGLPLLVMTGSIDVSMRDMKIAIPVASVVVLVLGLLFWFWYQISTPGPTPDQNSTRGVPEKPQPGSDTIQAKQRVQQGLSFASTGRIDQAVAEFSAAIKLDPKNATAYGNRGVAYIQQKKYNKAREDLQKAIEFEPNDRIALYNLAVVHTLQKNFDLALDALDKALENGFDNYDSLRNDKDLTELRKHPEFRKVLERRKIFL